MDLKQQVEEQKKALLRIASQGHQRKTEAINAKDIEEDIKLNELWYQALLYKKETGIISKSERAALYRMMQKRKIYMRLYNKSHR